MSLTTTRSAPAEPVPLTRTEVEEVKGGFLLLALLASCSGCGGGSNGHDTGTTHDGAETGGTGR